jgi:hypothetical protein
MLLRHGKTRGKRRRLRALDRWAEELGSAAIPERPERCDFWNNKLPVQGTLVRPPTTTRDLRRRAIAAMLRAATLMSRSVDTQATEYRRVACLITSPDLFHSEVTVFYARDYYRRFSQPEAAFTSRSLLAEFDLELPSGFVECGRAVEPEEEGDIPMEWWCIGQPL